MLQSVDDLLRPAINPQESRIKQLPHIVLVYGGQLGDPLASARQFFLNFMSVGSSPINSHIRTPEQYSDWNKFEGYGNLVDFESDAGLLTKAIVLFSESAGSFAELGAFCMDPVISERLFVVVSRENYNADSFIAHGPIKKIENLHPDNSVCVVDTLDPSKVEQEFAAIVLALEEKIRSIPKTQAFDPNRQRDKFLLIADLIELFGALTISEIESLAKVMQVTLSLAELKRILNQLIRFELIELIEKSTKRYYLPPSSRESYFDYASRKGAPAFDRTRFKMLTSTPWLQSDAQRYKAYCEIHSKA